VETEGNLTIELSKVEKKCEEKGKEIEGTCEYKDDIEINVCHEIKGLQKTITSESIDFKNYDIRNSEGCTSELTKIIEGTADISYNSISNPLIDKNTIYAGGGFTFTSQYLGAAKYNFVGLKYTIVDWFKEDNICKKVSISKRITKDMPEWNEAVEYMANQIRITGNATTKAHDSNNAKNPNSESQQKIVDTWQISNNYKTVKEDKKWYPDEELNYNYLFMLKKACINTQTAEVTYKEICDPNNEIEGINSEGESLYYIPLKWPDNTPFNVKVEVSANLIKGTNNPLYTYTCKVNTKQKLYNIEGDKISYKFVYRPISLSNPFPGRKDKIAEKYNHNWYWLVQPQNQITFDKYVTNGRTKTEPEYIVTLTPNEISRMKNYNKYHNYTDFYSNGSDGTNYSIGKNGRNNFLDAYNVKRASTLIYNELGKCIEGKCWNNATLNQEQDTE